MISKSNTLGRTGWVSGEKQPFLPSKRTRRLQGDERRELLEMLREAGAATVCKRYDRGETSLCTYCLGRPCARDFSRQVLWRTVGSFCPTRNSSSRKESQFGSPASSRAWSSPRWAYLSCVSALPKASESCTSRGSLALSRAIRSQRLR